MEEEEAKKIVESLTDSITSGEKKDIEESTKDIVKKAALAVSSLKETEFDIRFNPDVFRFVPNFSFQNDNLFDIGKGQLISKCPFSVIVWTKIPTKKFPRFLP